MLEISNLFVKIIPRLISNNQGKGYYPAIVPWFVKDQHMNNRKYSRSLRPMNALPRLALPLLLLIFSSTTYSQSLDLNTVLEQIIEAYGGEENLRKLDNQIQEWAVVALMGNRHGSDVRTIRIPDQLKVELTYPGKKETRIVNGEASCHARHAHFIQPVNEVQ